MPAEKSSRAAGRRTGGRVRSADARDAVMRATVELLEEAGYGGVTVEGVAARSEVAKSTVYRWWPSKAALVVDAYLQATADRMPDPDSGDLAADLTDFVTALYQVIHHPVRVKALTGLMAEAQLDPGFAESFRVFTAQRQAALAQIFLRAVDRGRLPRDLDLDYATDLVFGPFWYRLLLGHRPLDPAQARDHVATLLRGLLQPAGDPARQD
ncbi:TetR/AcrR family transcriptional regulator [Planobispora siamensis]|nr:TetR/AcrR family transcriptional regulator [Planobispora siamensis]